VAAAEAAKIGGENAAATTAIAAFLAVPNPQMSQALFCDLCNVSCSGREVMNSHLAGARHKKVGTRFY